MSTASSAESATTEVRIPLGQYRPTGVYSGYRVSTFLLNIFVFLGSEGDHPHPEEGPRHRSAEDPGESGADAADHEPAPVLILEAQHVSEETGDRSAGSRAGARPCRPSHRKRAL